MSAHQLYHLSHQFNSREAITPGDLYGKISNMHRGHHPTNGFVIIVHAVQLAI